MRETWNKSWNVNTTGTHILTHTFVPLLLKSSDPRLIFITSGTSTLAGSENTTITMNKSPTKGWPKQAYAIAAYRSSKTGMNMMMREWTRILREDGIKVWGIAPGFLATGLGGDQERNKQMGAEDPILGANFVRDVIEGTRDQDVGKVIRRVERILLVWTGITC
jgi:NAD(P)-dependent dehydrogenase (short-subunit alcohol dehydrogenase family)